MPEKDAILAGQSRPVTRSSLAAELRDLGVRPGLTLLVHASLKSLGWVAGGAHAVLLAIQDALGPRGTMVMPAHTGNLSEPSRWQNPAVPESWWPTIRDELPAFDPDLSPTWGIGALAETFRKQPGTRRSQHPSVSFIARGPRARAILRDRKLDFQMDRQSPLGRIYELDGQVLLLGVGYDANTSFHLAEYDANWPGKTVVPVFAPVARPFFRRRTWARYQDIGYDDEDFPAIGAALDQTGLVRQGQTGAARSRLYRQRDGVDFAIRWIEENRR